MDYDDGTIACTDSELVVRRYNLLLMPHRIPYTKISSVTVRSMGTWSGKWRIWGSGDLRHWLNFDASRPGKSQALVIDVGGWIRPTITPDDPARVLEVLRSHGVAVSDG